MGKRQSFSVHLARAFGEYATLNVVSTSDMRVGLTLSEGEVAGLQHMQHRRAVERQMSNRNECACETATDLFGEWKQGSSDWNFLYKRGQTSTKCTNTNEQ
jgi:hypothetical protein